MSTIEIDVRRAPGAGDVDLSELVLHWLGPNGFTEITSSTFSISAQRGSGTVLTDRSDVMTISNLGQTITDGQEVVVRCVTADGGVTTVILHSPDPVPADGAASLHWQSPKGKPSTGGGSTNVGSTLLANVSIEWTVSRDAGYRSREVDVGDSARGHSVVDYGYLETYKLDGMLVYSNDADGDDPGYGPKDTVRSNDLRHTGGDAGVDERNPSDGSLNWNTGPSTFNMNAVTSVATSGSGTVYVAGGDCCGPAD